MNVATRSRWFLVSTLSWIGVLLASCADAPVQEQPPPPVTVVLRAVAGASVNPDVNGSPSPVTIRVYQLAAPDAFAAADLLPVWEDERTALGASLLARHEYRLAPGGQAGSEILLDRSARHLGIAAAFRDYRGATWRATVAVPSPAVGQPPLRLTIAVDGRAVSATID